jgi:hypothetical protein
VAENLKFQLTTSFIELKLSMTMGLYKLFLQIDELPKSLNKGLRTNRFKYQRLNKQWDFMVACRVGEKGTPEKPLQKANITLIRHAHRTLDYDGLVGSMKPIVDALVTCGVLSDDSWAVTGRWNVDQKFRSKSEGPLLEILIQEMPIDTDKN